MKVELPPDSLATARAIHDLGDTYPVVLTVSIPITGFTERELRHTPGGYPSEIRVDAVDRMRVEIHNTTLDEVRDRLDELTAWLRTAVGRAAEAQRIADVEDDRLLALQETINNSLHRDR